MTDAECKRIVEISQRIEQLTEAKNTLKENLDTYLGILYTPKMYCALGDIRVLRFSPERLKMAKQWIDEDLKELQEELKNL